MRGLTDEERELLRLIEAREAGLRQAASASNSENAALDRMLDRGLIYPVAAGWGERVPFLTDLGRLALRADAADFAGRVKG